FRSPHRKDHRGHDRHGNLRWSLRADIEPDRVLDAADLLLAQPGLGQTLAAFGMVTAASQRADVETVRLDRDFERLVVDVAHVCHDNDGRVRVEAYLRECILRPFRPERYARETLGRRKGRSRVDDNDLITRKTCQLAQDLSDVR